MSIDLAKLTPAPWIVGVTDSRLILRSEVEECNVAEIIWEDRKQHWQPHDAAFIAVARAAFEVMMRRGWYAKNFGECDVGGCVWGIVMGNTYFNQTARGGISEFTHFADPFTALVEADTWYRENVEKAQVPA